MAFKKLLLLGLLLPGNIWCMDDAITGPVKRPVSVLGRLESASQKFRPEGGICEWEGCANSDGMQYNFASSEELYKHIESHLTSDLHICGWSGCGSKLASGMRTHLRIHARYRPFQCEECLDKFTDQSNLNRHKSIHKDAKPYKCDYCVYAAMRKADLKRHVIYRHSASASEGHTCKWEGCANSDGKSYIFVSAEELDGHVKSHLTTGLHICGWSGCGVTLVDRLSNHARTHTGYRPFQCDACDYRSAYKSDLKVHMARKHRDKTSDGAAGAALVPDLPGSPVDEPDLPAAYDTGPFFDSL